MTGIKIPLALPWFDEKESEAAAAIVKSKWLIFGKQAETFENEFAELVGAQYAIAVNSGSSALLVSLAAMGIEAGDEVIVPDMTFISTATAAMFLGARPIFTDLELNTYCMNPEDIEKRITPKTKLIMPVHYAGQTADMDPILTVAKKHNLRVLEDAAEAHLSEYKGKKCGTIGEMGIFSFTPSKPMTTGEGGMVVTNDKTLADKSRLIRNYGDTARFQWDLLGFNFRMPEVMGAIGRIQLRKLTKAIELRRKIAQRYTAGFKDEEAITTPSIRNYADHNFQLYTVRLKIDTLNISRDEVIAQLAEQGISTRLYYPSLHTQKVFARLGNYRDSDYPRTLEYTKTALSLPIFPDLTEGEIDYVTKTLINIIKRNKRR
ncbi:DegT/DnrJ/EryC1/StrS family aminotransferase [Candidatus Saganbacteria bacterium]|nr:DegT/DnrJ/EryC1/StrS family aminotransferase [Candidatus Saganbacteria bacterium]